jgi:hypothetical protein
MKMTLVEHRHDQPPGCPVWCVECEHAHVPDGVCLHQDIETRVEVYDTSSELAPIKVQAWHMDKLPADRGRDPAELEQPVLVMEVPDADVTLTPAQARRLAAVLLAKAEAVDPQPGAASA